MFSSYYRFVGGAGDSAFASALPANIDGVFRFLAMDRDDWNRLGNDIAYPYAWSLVYYLLKDPRHGPLVSAYFNSLAQHRCRALDQAGYLDLNYPGGLDTLATDWGAWLNEGQAVALTY